MATERQNTATMWRAITASANAIEPRPTALWVGGAGSITVEGTDGISVAMEVPQGLCPIQPVRMTAATATGVVALYNEL